MNKNWQTETINGQQVTFFRYDTQYAKDAGITYRGVENPDGTFTIPTHDGLFEHVRSIGYFESFREADIHAECCNVESFPYACWLEGDAENDYILYSKERSYYFSI